ncbi:MAG: rhodanese-like domain-containing protein [Rubrimonas sp.]|uniref:rhodanese-like domain-containing protein n=1 Tax=Rubrimonas sp. TaxID=2036015 RepID=UPI002FDD4625
MNKIAVMTMAGAGVVFVAGAAMLYSAITAEQGVTADRLAALSREVAQGGDQITAPELSRRVIEARNDFTLVDVRAEKDYAAEHIPGARNLSAGQVLSERMVDTLRTGKPVILYDDGRSAQAAQAAMLLRAVGVEAKALRGGMDSWLRYTLDPNSDLEEAAGIPMAERVAVACYFQGDYLPESGMPVKAVVAAYAPGLVAPIDTPTLGRPAPGLGAAAAAKPAAPAAGGGAFSAGQGC